jgi:hypothetical protein
VTHLTVRRGGGIDDGLERSAIGDSAMEPTTPLKLGAVVFAVIWTGWMLWSLGLFTPANDVLWTIGGTTTGYLWYRAMLWQFRRSGLMPRN